ncbi:MAG: CDP-alcohol phosphatidyltransferase family protein [bacterium]|nr:CDP-alcohol phosphatidyltransferase family protein [bacterium]
MLNKFGRRYVSKVLRPITNVLIDRISPNGLTIIGFIFALLSAIFFSQGKFISASILVIISGLFDIFDGELAKTSGRITTFGGFLDSVMDRYSDTSILIGIIFFYAKGGDIRYVIVTSIALVGFVMVSYTRARAESLIKNCSVGLMERATRMIVLAIGGFLNLLNIALWILAVSTHITACHRIFYTWKATK